MKKTILKITVATFVIAFLSVMGYMIVHKLMIKKEAAEKIKEVPVFKFYTLTDGSFTNENVVENKPVIIIHFNPDCENCQDEATDLHKSINLLSNAQILMVSDAKKDAVEKFMVDYQLNTYQQIIPLLDKDGIFFKSFGQVLNPLVFIYNKEHHLVRYYVGQTKVEAISKAMQQ